MQQNERAHAHAQTQYKYTHGPNSRKTQQNTDEEENKTHTDTHKHYHTLNMTAIHESLTYTATVPMCMGLCVCVNAVNVCKRKLFHVGNLKVFSLVVVSSPLTHENIQTELVIVFYNNFFFFFSSNFQVNFVNYFPFNSCILLRRVSLFFSLASSMVSSNCCGVSNRKCLRFLL